MADPARRKPPAAGTGAGARSPPHYQQQQQQPLKGFVPAPMAGNSRYGRSNVATGNGHTGNNASNTRGGGAGKPAGAKMGIKSGMTVEDLKRLTQQRMQQGAAATSTAPTTQPTPTPTLNMAAVNTSTAGGAATATPTTTTPIVPKAGMSVQELKQLTSLRLASQNVPVHQSEITGLVSKAVLSNAAKSHYRESLRGSLTPSTTPKRTSVPNVPTPAMQHDGVMMAGRHSLPGRPRGIPGMGGVGGTASPAVPTAAASSVNQFRYSYSGPDDFAGYDPMGRNSGSSQETDPYARPSLDVEEENKYGYEEQYNSLQFPDDAFPPPPPLDDNGSFYSTALPSWSPPPARSKKIDTVVPPPVNFYSQAPSYFGQSQYRDDVGKDQNAIIAPPPGLTRRPSMTVPWQVAEAVLNTPQTTTNRKTLLSPTNSSNARDSQPESSNMFAIPPPKAITRNESLGLKNPAAEAAAELGALSLGRQRSGAAGPVPLGPNTTAAPGMLGTSPPGNGSAGARRGSFGNAAEFFKFRRRSKSRLELARDLSGAGYGSELSGIVPNYGAMGTSGIPPSNVMPGIDESRADIPSDYGAASGTDNNATDSGYDEDAESGGGSFLSFYNATGVRRSRGESLSGLSNLSIPPPPPPPLTDDEDEADSTTSSSKGLPMMSPNGVRLRKVAEMARRGSLSNEDKTRVKDEIIQNSLGISASNAARILAAKPTAVTGAGVPSNALAANQSNNGGVERPPVSPSMPGPPPGFQRLASNSAASTSTPPRDTPKASLAKTIPAGIVRSTSTGIAARSPPKPSMMLSPTSSARKAVTPPTSGQATLASLAQAAANCANQGDMEGFQRYMDELNRLRTEAATRG